MWRNLVSNQTLIILVISSTWRERKEKYIYFSFQRDLVSHPKKAELLAWAQPYRHRYQSAARRIYQDSVRKSPKSFILLWEIYISQKRWDGAEMASNLFMYGREKTSQLLGAQRPSVRLLGESLFHKWKIQSLLLLGPPAHYPMLRNILFLALWKRKGLCSRSGPLQYPLRFMQLLR